MQCGFSALTDDAKIVKEKRKKENSQPCKRGRGRENEIKRGIRYIEKDKESHHTYRRIDPHCQSTWGDDLREVENKP